MTRYSSTPNKAPTIAAISGKVDQHTLLLESQNAELKLQNDALQEQSKKLKENENLIKSFNIIVAITLVGTLIGVFAIYMQNRQTNDNGDIADATLIYLLEQINQNKVDMAILKAKNPNLK